MEPSAEDCRRVAELRGAIRRFLRRGERLAREEGLTPSRYLLLLMIKGAPDGSERSTVTELAARMQLTQSTITELVARAEEVGLVVREQSAADARGLLDPADAGRRAPTAPDRRAERPRPALPDRAAPDGRLRARGESRAAGALR